MLSLQQSSAESQYTSLTSNASGLEFLQKKRYTQAIAKFSRAIYLEPTEPTYYWHRGEAYLAICDFEGCIVNLMLFRKWVADGYVVRKRLANVSFTYGQCLLDQKRYHEAEKYFILAKECGFHVDDVYLRLALAKIGQDDIPASLDLLYEVINNHCMDVDVYVLRAKLYYFQRNIFLSIQDLRVAKQLDPEHPEIPDLQHKVLEYAVDFKNKASEQIHRRDYKTALWYLNQVMELDMEDWKCLMLRGIILGELDQYEEGLADLLEVLGNDSREGDREMEIKHNISKLHNKAAIKLFEEQKYEMALERFSIALNFCPTDNLIRKNRSECYLAAKQVDMAAKDLLECLSNDPEDMDSKQRIAFIDLSAAQEHIKNREYKSALERITKV
jgi:tetratricopeptide (TPR) repeat protein